VDWYLPAGSAADGAWTLSVTPDRAGWTYTSLRVLTLAPGESHPFHTGTHEMLVLPLSGGCHVDVDGVAFDLDGRAGVFDRVSDFCYLPCGTAATITSVHGGRFALPGALARRRLEPRYGPAAEVAVELRGAGSCSRQVNNIAVPRPPEGGFECDRLIVVEVLTPGGNWSSYPPHKHDEATGTEVELEEIYYFEVARGSGGQDGAGYQRVYGTPGRPIDVLAEVRSGDTVLVPHGWHGPSIAAPGYDLYYLNAMAGPGPDRTWLFCDDPAHAWIRDTWPDQPVDPRLPLTGRVAP
jgi:5-deoxy-glucuronate isomerase